MDQFRNLDISASGIRSNRTWMEVIASNIANAKTTKTPEGGPYRAQVVTFGSVLSALSKDRPSEQVGTGVKVDQVTADTSPFLTLFDPSHPDANKEGYVSLPNVNPMQEMAKMMIATRSYEANLAAFGASKNMYMKALEIGR